jgi:hypothetical protein
VSLVLVSVQGPALSVGYYMTKKGSKGRGETTSVDDTDAVGGVDSPVRAGAAVEGITVADAIDAADGHRSSSGSFFTTALQLFLYP